jgi:outer membrane protein assembly factor BamD
VLIELPVYRPRRRIASGQIRYTHPASHRSLVDALNFSSPKIADSPTQSPRHKLWCAAVTALLLTALLSGCGNKNRDAFSGADELFERGTKSMNGGNHANAIGYYEALEARYPFSNQAKQAQLNLVFCYYKNGEPDAAIDAAVQFERENPTHPRVDYALYMRGLAQFSPEHGAFHRLMRLDLAKRPPVAARESFSAFSRLVQRYPESRYAADSRQRMIFLRDRLARHENFVAQYYYERGAFVAALNRAKYTVENFDGAPAVADSLFIMVGSYEKLGMQDLATDTRRVLIENYPDAAKPKVVKKRFLFF